MTRKVHTSIVHTDDFDAVHIKTAAVIESILRNGGRIEGITTIKGRGEVSRRLELRTTVYWSKEV